LIPPPAQFARKGVATARSTLSLPFEHPKPWFQSFASLAAAQIKQKNPALFYDFDN
jgi:hypothetical protein